MCSVKCEMWNVCSMKCAVPSVQCELWSLDEFGLWSVECEVCSVGVGSYPKRKGRVPSQPIIFV